MNTYRQKTKVRKMWFQISNPAKNDLRKTSESISINHFSTYNEQKKNTFYNVKISNCAAENENYFRTTTVQHIQMDQHAKVLTEASKNHSAIYHAHKAVRSLTLNLIEQTDKIGCCNCVETSQIKSERIIPNLLFSPSFHCLFHVKNCTTFFNENEGRLFCEDFILRCTHPKDWSRYKSPMWKGENWIVFCYLWVIQVERNQITFEDLTSCVC